MRVGTTATAQKPSRLQVGRIPTDHCDPKRQDKFSQMSKQCWLPFLMSRLSIVSLSKLDRQLMNSSLPRDSRASVRGHTKEVAGSVVEWRVVPSLWQCPRTHCTECVSVSGIAAMDNHFWPALFPSPDTLHPLFYFPGLKKAWRGSVVIMYRL